MSDEEVWNYDKDFHNICNNESLLKEAVDGLLTNIIDEHTLGIIFEQHRKFKTNALDKDVYYDPEKLNPPPLGVEIFGNNNLRKNQECACPNCKRVVACTKFAPHLEGCMGMGRRRTTGRRTASTSSGSSTVSRDRETPSFGEIPTDDDESDIDWNPDKKKKKREGRNGAKKSNTKKSSEPDPIESMGADDDLD